MIFQTLTDKTTFEQTFVNKAVTLHVSELLALCNFSKSSGYIQPNMNHHFINENSSFKDLDKSFISAIKGETTISTEYDAVLSRKEGMKGDSVHLQLPTYNVVSEKKADEVVVVVDSRVFEGFLEKLPSLKEKIAAFKKVDGNVEDFKGVQTGEDGAEEPKDGKLEQSGHEAGAKEAKSYDAEKGEPGEGEGKESDTGEVEGKESDTGEGKGNESDAGEGEGNESDAGEGEGNESDAGEGEGNESDAGEGEGNESDAGGGEGNESDAGEGEGNESEAAIVENIPESDGSTLSVADGNDENDLDEDNTKPFLMFIEEMRSISEGLCLSFLDGLHRSYSLVSFASKSDKNFQTVLSSAMNVTINFYMLKPNPNLILEEPHLSEIEQDLEWYENIYAFSIGDIEIVLSLTQEKSGTLMLSKKATVGHTVLDAYSVLSRSVRNNSANVYFSSAIYQTRIHKRKIWKHVLLDYSTGKNKYLHLDELNTRLFLEKFFKNFFFNTGFEEWAKQGLPMSMKRDIMKNDGTYIIESVYDGFYSKYKWEILFTLKGDFRSIQKIFVQGPCGFGRNNKLFCKTSLTVANMLLISLARLFLLTPTIRETAHNNMTSMQLRGLLSKERLLFVTGIADHISGCLLKFYSQHFKRTEEMQIQIRFILRTNLENLLLSLYSKEVIDDLLGPQFEVPFQLPDVHPFEYSLLEMMWLHDKLDDKSMSHKTMFLDGLAFSYGRYLLYFLIFCPFLATDMLPVLWTLLNPEKTKDTKSKNFASIARSKNTDMEDYHVEYELNTAFSLVERMNLINTEFAVSSISAREFIKGCLKFKEDGPQSKSELSNESWNPLYPIPFIRNMLHSLHELEEFESDEEYHLIMDTLQEYHENDTVFIKDIKSPQKQKRKRGTPTTDSSTKSKKNKTVMLYDSSDDEDMDKKRMDYEYAFVGKRMDYEYAFVGVPVQQDIENEPKSTSNDEIIESSTEQSCNAVQEDVLKSTDTGSNDVTYDLDLQKADENEDTGVEEYDDDIDEIETLLVRRSSRLANSNPNDLDAMEDEEGIIPISSKDGNKKKSNLTEEKEYLFFKAYTTYNFLDSEKNYNELTKNPTITEITCKLYWLNNLQAKNRKEMLNTHYEIMDSAFKEHKSLNEDYFYDALEYGLSLMGTALNNHRESALGKLFERARSGTVAVRTTSSELDSIFKKFNLCPTPFTTDITFPEDYIDGDLQFGNNVGKITFLDPFNIERKIKVTATVSFERFLELLQPTFGNIQNSGPEIKSSRGASKKEFTFSIQDCPSFYERVLFIANDVVANKNLVKTKEAEYLRLEFYHDKNTFFLENLEYDSIFRIIDEKAKAYVAPFDTKRNLPMYHDYFKIDPPIDEEVFPKDFGSNTVSIVAKILGVLPTDIREATNVLNDGTWYCCVNRYILLKSLLLGETFFAVPAICSDDEIDFSDSDDDDESLSESDKETSNKNNSQPQTIAKRVTRSTKKSNHGRFKTEGTSYLFKIGNKKHYIKFAKVSMTEKPLYYKFDQTIHTISDFHTLYIKN